MTAIQQIFDFNYDAGLLIAPYSDIKEDAYPIEESLEGYPHLGALAAKLQAFEETPKSISRSIIEAASTGSETIQEVDRLDKKLDTIVFAFGSIFKLGLTPEQALRALSVVMDANQQKLGLGQDANGKQLKPTDFESPEPQLQLILDERQPG